MNQYNMNEKAQISNNSKQKFNLSNCEINEVYLLYKDRY